MLWSERTIAPKINRKFGMTSELIFTILITIILS